MSKVFEFHFNPIPLKHKKEKPIRLNIAQGGIHRIPFFKKPKPVESIFNSFCYFPETRKENNLGVLYLMGELKNPMPGTENLISEIAQVIKQEYYSGEYETQQDCFSAALSKADEYLDSIKKQNTDFLGNLNFTAISLLNDFSVSVSMAGKAKIFILTGRNIFDIGDNFSTGIKCFSNVVEGNLESSDKIIVMTENLFTPFYNNEIFHNLIDIKKSKHIKELFKIKKQDLNQEFGCCLLVLVKKQFPRIFLKSFFTKKNRRH